MKSVWKFAVNITDHIAIQMPAGAQILSFQMQVGKPWIWALVNPDAHPVRRLFRIAGTGHPIDDADVDRLTFVGTIQVYGGELIFHLFEIRESA